MAAVRRVGLFSREVVERLSLAGVEMLLARVSRLSEGQVVDHRYFGSTMLTLDLRALDDEIRDSCDVATALRLARLWTENETVREQIQAIGFSEACRIAGHALAADGIDVRIRAEGSWLFVDIDVEATVACATAVGEA